MTEDPPGQDKEELHSQIQYRLVEELIASERRYLDLLDNIQEVVFRLDCEGKVTFLNRAWRDTLGHEPDEALGMPLSGFLDDRGSEWLRGVLEDGRDGSEQERRWRSLTLRDIQLRERHVIVSIQSVEGGWIGSMVDRTDERRIEEQLHQSQKMEAVGRLAGGVAHGFNNLLTGIIGVSDILLASETLSQSDRRDLTLIRGSGERAAVLTRKLLAFGRKQVMQPRVVNVSRQLSSLAPMLRSMLGENCELIITEPSEAPLVYVDPLQFEQVVLNLALNARDAMPRGGRIDIALSIVELSAGDSVHSHHLGPGCYVQMSITDTGCGMDEVTMARAFEPFFSTRPPDRGSGLGLSTVHGIVNQAGGKIEVVSQVGLGSTFHLLFPLSAMPAAGSDAPGQSASTAVGEGTILVVEDEDVVLNLVSRVLETAGFTVLEARGPLEAQEVFAEQGGRVDLLVTDVVMPVMGGHALHQLLQEEHKALRVLFMSGYTEETLVQHGIDEDDVPFIHKPFKPDQLIAKIQEILVPPVTAM